MTSLEVLQHKAEKTEEELYLEDAIDLEKTLAVFRDEAVALGSNLFTSEEEAHQAGVEFRDEWSEELVSVGDINFYPLIRATGEGIIVPNPIVGRTEDGYIIVGLDEKNNAEMTEFYESADGYMNQIHTGVKEFEMGTGTYQAVVHLTLSQKNPKSFSAHTADLPAAVLEGTVTARTFVPVNEGIMFDVPARAELEKRAYVAESLARSGLQKTLLLKTINELGGQLLTAIPSGYTELEGIDRVKLVARQCVEYANQGVCSIGVLTDKLLEIFQKGKPLKIAEMSQQDEYTIGNIYDIYPQLDEDGKTTKLCLALDISPDPKDAEIVTFGFDDLVEIHY